MSRHGTERKILVLGAGVVGVATAYFLARAGAAVTVMDRQPDVALETSFANGGQISANHATPWAGPATPWKALKWLGDRRAPLLIHPRFDPPLLAWLARFLRNCTTSRVKVNLERALRLALYSRAETRAIREREAMSYDHLERGILHIFRDRAEYEAALSQLELMNDLGCRRRLLDPAECVALEPALAAMDGRLIAGIYSPDDESGDAHIFTNKLKNISERLGAQFVFNAHIQDVVVRGGAVTAVRADEGEIAADTVIVALGSYSTPLLKRIGIRLPVYPAKGYSITLPLTAPDLAPVVSLIDDEYKMVYSRFGARLRIAGTAEFAGYDASVDPVRARFLLDKALELFPGCARAEAAQFWAGLRPSTPDGGPILGETPIANLLLNTGHGTLGWTMACGSGRLIADFALGRPTGIPLAPYGLARFS